MRARITSRFLLIGLSAAAILATSCFQPSSPAAATDWAAQRKQMVQHQLAARDIRNERVLAVMGRVPRHEFVPDAFRDRAYADHPLPIGEGQTISQPYIVAFMTEQADPQPKQRVLEVGTGSGYQAAVLAELVGEVYTIELVPSLARDATARLKRLGYSKKVQVREGDGYLGWPDAAPFDSILVTCGADHVPDPLFQQLKPGGKLIIPVGPRSDQVLRVIEKGPRGERRSRDVLPVRFVPLRRAEDVQKK